MSVQFSTSELISLEKEIITAELAETSVDEIDFAYDIEKCADWIRKHNFKKVCLQFPDHLLPDASKVIKRLQSCLQQTLYVLGDTAYESCCIDYITAAHINADAVIHYGPVCFSRPIDQIPFLNVHEKLNLNISALTKTLHSLLSTNPDIALVIDTSYLSHLASIQESLPNTKVYSIMEHNIEKCLVIIGNNLRKILNYKLSFKPDDLYYYDPAKEILTNYKLDPKVLKRRYYLIEKVKDSRTIGIIIGTLAVRNYLKVLKRIKKLIQKAGKKYYVISVGKPTVAKLANFAEMDVYVVVSCAMNEIYDSRDFYKPIVTPYDIEVALNTSADPEFTYNYNDYLTDSEIVPNLDSDVSLITGNLRLHQEEDGKQSNDVGKDVAIRSDGVVANFGAGFLADRNWKGLEQNLDCDKPMLVTEGRRGIAQGYSNEKL